MRRIQARGTMKRSMMEDALQVKAKNGVLAAADFLMNKGFPYDLALMALVGLRRANHYYGLEQKNVSSEKRGRYVR